MPSRLRRAVRDSTLSAWLAGLIAVMISFAGPAVLIIEAARAAGLDADSTSSWIWAVAIGSGIICLTMSFTMRTPVIVAWSIPGSVVLISSAGSFSWAELVGVYIVVALASLLLVTTGWLTRLMRRIPAAVTGGVLAGILMPLIFGAAVASAEMPILALTMLATFLTARRRLPRFAVPLTMLAGVATLVALRVMDPSASLPGGSVFAQPVWTTPSFDITAVVSVGIPLLLVTMAGQNIPGIAILDSLGYRFRSRGPLTACAAGSLLLAPFGSHALNLATVTQAVCAGPEAHPARRRRYIAGISSGVWYLVAGLFAPLFVLLVTSMPGAALSLLAGLVLLPTLLTTLTEMFRATQASSRAHGHLAGREAGVVALVVTASEVEALGITSPCWGLLAGLLTHLALTASPTRRVRPAGHRPSEQRPTEHHPARHDERTWHEPHRTALLRPLPTGQGDRDDGHRDPAAR